MVEKQRKAMNREFTRRDTNDHTCNLKVFNLTMSQRPTN